MDDVDESLFDRIDDAIEDVLNGHQPLNNDSQCSCGARNNMDGDVLHGHRLSELSDAVRHVLDEFGFHAEYHPTCPISVPEFHEDGSPVIEDRVIPNVQKHHFEWVPKQRWVTDWQEVGPRMDSAAFAAQLEAVRSEDASSR
jgi:hypothetical protein